jgi:hypothetical protein
MTLTSKDHYEMIEFFERNASKFSSVSFRLEKEPKDMWSKGRVYQDGKANDAFLMFRLGVSYGKALQD